MIGPIDHDPPLTVGERVVTTIHLPPGASGPQAGEAAGRLVGIAPSARIGRPPCLGYVVLDGEVGERAIGLKWLRRETAP